MRDDPSQDDSFRDDSQWDNQKYQNRVLVDSAKGAKSRSNQKWGFTSNSLSGRERNRMFLRHKDNFSDVTLISGVDDIADGRSFALLDFDQDGWQDIAMMSLNSPRFKLYRNELQTIYPDNSSFRFRFIGGQRAGAPSVKLSNRDGIGATALITFASGNKLLVQRQAGEGFASQNSDVKMIGVPKGDSVERVEVRWPSGLKTEIMNPNISEILMIREVRDE
ncbi:MAG: ASPIC/UnbV domain-containing protein [Pirellulales bacterium]